MTKLRKALVMSLSVITVFSMSMIAVPFQADAAMAGDLIKIDGYSPVYYLGDDMKRYVFPNEATYFSWYSDFSTVVTVDQTEVESYPLAANVVMRPGTKLVKRPVPTDPKVYAVEPNGVLRHVPDEATAVALYGDDWAMRVVDVADSFFVNYSISATEVSADEYPAGSLVKYGDGADVYYVNADGEAQKIADEAAFAANGFSWDNVLTAPEGMTMPTAGDDVTGKTAAADTAQGGNSGTGPVVDPNVGSGLSVALSSDTPEANNIPTGISVEMLRFNLTAANDGDVTVTTMTLTAGGLGDGQAIDNVAIFVDGTKYGNSKDINSSDEATFNFADAIELSAGATKEVVVKAEVSATDTYRLAVNEAADIVTNGATVSGSFPIRGSIMSGVSATVGGLTFDADDNDDTAQVGEDEVSAVAFTVEATGEDVYFSGLTLKNEGNLDAEDCGTFSLLMNDDEIATANMLGDYVSFSFDEILIEENDVEDFEVLVDLEGGSAAETLRLVIDDDADVDAMGKKGYPASVTRTAFADSDANSTEITLEAGDLVINFNSTDAPAQDILADTDNVVLGRLEITANAEAVTVEDIAFTVTGTGVDMMDLENFEMIGVGATVGSYDLTVGASSTPIDLSTDDDIYIAKGETISFDIRADVTADADINNTYRVELASSDITAEGVDSEEDITDITPSSAEGEYMTVVASGLSHTTLSLGDVTAVAGNDEDTKIYKGRFTAATASGVKVTKVIFEDNNNATSDFNETDINDLTFEVYNQDGEMISSEVETDITEDNAAANTVTFNDDFVVPAGEYVDFYLLATFAGSAAANTAFTIAVDSVTAKNDGSVNNNDDAVTVTPSATAGPTVTLAESGYLDISMSVTESEANSDALVTAGKESGLMATLKLDAQDEDINIEDIYFAATENDSDIFDDIAAVQLIASDGVTVLDSTNLFTVGDYALKGAAADGTNDVLFKFEDWNYNVEEEGVEEIYLNVITQEIGTGEQVGTSGTSIEFSIYSVKAEGSNGELTMVGTSTPSSSDVESAFDYDTTTNAVKNVGINVTSIVDDISDTSLTGGENIIGEFKFSFDTGNNTDADGNDAEFNFVTIDLTIGADVTSIGGVELYWASDENTKVTVASSTIDDAGTYTINLSTLEGVSTEDTLVVKALDVSGYTDKYIQTKLLDVDTTVVWNDGTGGSNLTGVLLDYVDITSDSVSN